MHTFSVSKRTCSLGQQPKVAARHESLNHEILVCGLGAGLLIHGAPVGISDLHRRSSSAPAARHSIRAPSAHLRPRERCAVVIRSRPMPGTPSAHSARPARARLGTGGCHLVAASAIEFGSDRLRIARRRRRRLWGGTMSDPFAPECQPVARSDGSSGMKCGADAARRRDLWSTATVRCAEGVGEQPIASVEPKPPCLYPSASIKPAKQACSEHSQFPGRAIVTLPIPLTTPQPVARHSARLRPASRADSHISVITASHGPGFWPVRNPGASSRC